VVHPHACGEYVDYIGVLEEEDWSIPTRVGNTFSDYPFIQLV